MSEAVAWIRSRVGNFSPRLALILGSGMGQFVESLDLIHQIKFSEIPGWPPCLVKGHEGQLMFAQCNGVPILCLQGRHHYYEGKSHQQIRDCIKTLFGLGCKALLTTAAVGSMHAEWAPGRLGIVSDHLNFQFNNPLVGNQDEPRFVSLVDAYDPKIRGLIKQCAKDLAIELVEGVYVGTIGPSFETPSEIKAYKMLGGDFVGMSTIPEVIVARQCGMRVGSFVMISNFAAGLSDTPITHEEVLETGRQASGELSGLLVSVISALAEEI